MRMTSRAAIALFLLALPAAAAAERTVTATEFEEMVSGRTLHFDRDGRPFGSEQYFEDRRVIWAFEGGTCQRGIWFENSAGEICFVYDGQPVPQCWDFLQMPGGGFHARSVGEGPDDDLVMSRSGDEALDCPPPDLGV